MGIARVTFYRILSVVDSRLTIESASTSPISIFISSYHRTVSALSWWDRIRIGSAIVNNSTIRPWIMADDHPIEQESSQDVPRTFSENRT